MTLDRLSEVAETVPQDELATLAAAPMHEMSDDSDPLNTPIASPDPDFIGLIDRLSAQGFVNAQVVA